MKWITVNFNHADKNFSFGISRNEKKMNLAKLCRSFAAILILPITIDSTELKRHRSTSSLSSIQNHSWSDEHQRSFRVWNNSLYISKCIYNQTSNQTKAYISIFLKRNTNWLSNLRSFLLLNAYDSIYGHYMVIKDSL